MTDPIVKSVTVPLPPDRAFRLFTEEMSDWWPRDRPVNKGGEAPEGTVTVTPEKGGPVFETRRDGTSAEWGRVTEWKPGQFFGMTWHFGDAEAEESHVQVRFDAVADGTRVTLVHDGWQALRTAPAAMGTVWSNTLCTRFRAACRAMCVPA